MAKFYTGELFNESFSARFPVNFQENFLYLFYIFLFLFFILQFPRKLLFTQKIAAAVVSTRRTNNKKFALPIFYFICRLTALTIDNFIMQNVKKKLNREGNEEKRKTSKIILIEFYHHKFRNKLSQSPSAAKILQQ